MAIVLRGWPWLGLAIAVGMVLVDLYRRRGRPFSERFDDPSFWVWVGLPVYMLHQVEEHGVDALGRTYAFQSSLCQTIGHVGPLATCPASEAFILAVNAGAVWIAFVIGGLAGPKRPLFALAALGIPAVNAVAHIAPAVRGGGYNPGLVTALVLFLPLVVAAIRAYVRLGMVPRRALPLVPASGVLVHAVLLGSLWLRTRGIMDEATADVIQAANGLVPPALAWVLARLGVGEQ